MNQNREYKSRRTCNFVSFFHKISKWKVGFAGWPIRARIFCDPRIGSIERSQCRSRCRTWIGICSSFPIVGKLCSPIRRLLVRGRREGWRRRSLGRVAQCRRGRIHRRGARQRHQLLWILKYCAIKAEISTKSSKFLKYQKSSKNVLKFSKFSTIFHK